MSIRPMHSDDMAIVAALNQELGYSGAVDAMRARFEAISRRPEQGLFVAVLESHVAGWVHVQGHQSLESGAFAEISGLVVAAHARRHGLGRSLVERAKQWAAERGYSCLRVRSNVARDEAHKFYPALGFRLTKTSHNYQVEVGVP
jgi:GNAT superfamily N-acetyltransferase